MYEFLTGFYGIPGSQRAADYCTQVHVVFKKDKAPLCGVRLRRTMQFQWCANRIDREIITCLRCKQVMASKRFQKMIGGK